jgi:hypothetical protein
LLIAKIPGALGQLPAGSLVTANIFFCRNHCITMTEDRGAAINIFFNFGGAAIGHSDSTPRGPAIDVP